VTRGADVVRTWAVYRGRHDRHRACADAARARFARHVLVKALSPAFFARGDTLTPLMATLGGFAVAIVLGIVLVVYMAPAVSRPASRSGVGWRVHIGPCIAAGFGFSIDDACRRRLPRIGGAALVMGGLLWAATRFALAQNAGLHGLAQPQRCWF